MMSLQFHEGLDCIGASQSCQTGISLRIHLQKKLPGLHQGQWSVDLGPRFHSVSDILVCLATTSYIDLKPFPLNSSLYSLKSIYKNESLI